MSMSEEDDALFDFQRTRGEPKIELRYNRAERLEHAPENVQKLHRGEYTKKMGLVKRLFSTPALSMLAVVILLMLAFLAFYQREKPTLTDFAVHLSCTFSEQSQAKSLASHSTAFVALEITPKTENLNGEEITILFLALDKNDIILNYEKVSAIYMAEPLTLHAALQIPSAQDAVKAISAQIQINEQTMLIRKKL